MIALNIFKYLITRIIQLEPVNDGLRNSVQKQVVEDRPTFCSCTLTGRHVAVLSKQYPPFIARKSKLTWVVSSTLNSNLFSTLVLENMFSNLTVMCGMLLHMIRQGKSFFFMINFWTRYFFTKCHIKGRRSLQKWSTKNNVLLTLLKWLMWWVYI